MNGETALHVAAVRGFYSIVRLLCEHGAELNPVNAVRLCVKNNHTHNNTLILYIEWLYTTAIGD